MFAPSIHQRPPRTAKKNAVLLQGTLDMLILKVLTLGPMHGYAIVRRIQQISDEVLQVEEGSLYPALHRMQQRGWIEAEWGTPTSRKRSRVGLRRPRPSPVVTGLP